MEIFVCKVQYCDFCVRTFLSQSPGPSLHVERIMPDAKLWEDFVKHPVISLQAFYLNYLTGGTLDPLLGKEHRMKLSQDRTLLALLTIKKGRKIILLLSTSGGWFETDDSL